MARAQPDGQGRERDGSKGQGQSDTSNGPSSAQPRVIQTNRPSRAGHSAEEIYAVIERSDCPSPDLVGTVAEMLVKNTAQSAWSDAIERAFALAIETAIEPHKWAVVRWLDRERGLVLTSGVLAGTAGAGAMIAEWLGVIPAISGVGEFFFGIGSALMSLGSGVVKSVIDLPLALASKKRVTNSTELLEAAINAPNLVAKTAELLLHSAFRGDNAIINITVVPKQLLQKALLMLGKYLGETPKMTFKGIGGSQKHLVKLACSCKPEDHDLAQAARNVLAYTNLDDDIANELAGDAKRLAEFFLGQNRAASGNADSGPQIPVPQGKDELLVLLLSPELRNPKNGISRPQLLTSTLSMLADIISKSVETKPPT